MKSHFFRLNYPSHFAIDTLIASENLNGRMPELGALLRPGHVVLAVSYEPSSAVGQVRAMGRVMAAGARLKIDWRAIDFKLHPSPQGQQQWKKEHFCFDKTVAQRYKLDAHVNDLFSDV